MTTQLPFASVENPSSTGRSSAQADHPSHAPHFRELPELGNGAYVDADLGGWTASAAD